MGIIPLQEIIFKEATSSQQSKNFRRIHFRATVSLYCYHSNIMLAPPLVRYKIFAQTVGDVDTTLPSVLRELGNTL